jgi:hypothetical protein
MIGTLLNYNYEEHAYREDKLALFYKVGNGKRIKEESGADLGCRTSKFSGVACSIRSTD